MEEKNQLPTQIYVSVNSSNEKQYNEFQKSRIKGAWDKVNQTLEELKVKD